MDKNSVYNRLMSMTLDQKIAQLLMVGFNGTVLSSPMQRLFSEIPTGGVILFRYNLFTDNESITSLINQIQDSLTQGANVLPGLVAVDLEGGMVKRFKPTLLNFPAAMDLGERNIPGEITSLCKDASKVLLKLGFNMNLAPVLEPCSPVMKTRVFSCALDRVASCGIQFIKGFQSNGIIATGKHFPGNAGVDPHYKLGKIKTPYNVLDTSLFVPFKTAIDHGVSAIMVSHVYLTDIDKTLPASLSSKVINGTLRSRLGFKGLVISDDLLCSGKEGLVLASISTISESAVKSVQAGVDMLILSDAKYTHSVFQAIKTAVSNGIIEKKDLDRSVERILLLKTQYKIIGP